MIKLGLINLAGGMLIALATVEAGASESVQAVSVAAPGQPQSIGGNGDSTASIVSPDGRFVLFLSWANNLVTNDANGLFIDVFLRNRTNGTTTLVSENLAGTGGGNGHSLFPSASSDGRYVVFASAATDLVANDTNLVIDIFLRDLAGGTTTLLSVNQSGAGTANGESSEPVMTPDGRYVAFVSAASNLVPNDTNGLADVFVRDLQSGTTILASENAVPPYPGAGGSDSPALTADGRYLAFVSSSSNLVAGITNNSLDVYVRDLQTGVTTWAGTNAAAIMLGVTNAAGKPLYAYNPVLSADGRFMAFKAAGAANLILRHDLQTGVTDLVATGAIASTIGSADSSGPEITPDGSFVAFTAQTNATDPGQVFRWDAQSGASTLVSSSLNGGAGTNSFADTPAISADGRFVAFLSDAPDLVANATNGTIQVFIRDLVTGTTRLVSADTAGGTSGEASGAIPTISADGRLVAFDGFDGGYVPNDGNVAFDVFVRDTVADTTELVSPADSSLLSRTGNGISSLYPNAVSANGRFVVFTSLANDLVTHDTNGTADVFVHDRQTGTNQLASVNTDGGGANLPSNLPAISADGHHVVFASSATNLVPADENGQADIFVRNLETGTTTLVSQNLGFDGTNSATANGESSSPAISEDGRYVAFLSRATNLAPGISGTALNTYWRDRQSGTTVALTTNGSDFPTMSRDGRFVAYTALIAGRPRSLVLRDMQLQTNLLNGEFSQVAPYIMSANGGTVVYQASSNGQWPIFAWDAGSRSNRLLGFSSNPGVSGSGLVVSADGQFVVWVNRTNTLFVSDGFSNVLLYDLRAATTTLLSVNTNGTGGGNANSDSPSISADGRFVAYRSFASDLVVNDLNGLADVFIFDRLTGINSLVSGNRAGNGTGNGISAGPLLSADGRTVVFRSVASDLIDGDDNGTQDIFSYANTATSFTDSDTDGMDDNWEYIHFGGLSHDGQSDSDGDGLSDHAEFLAGTEPANGNSVFGVRSVSLSPWPWLPILSWPAAPGRGYRAQFKNNLNDPTWTEISGGVRVTGGTAMVLDYPSAPSSQRFYRILLAE